MDIERKKPEVTSAIVLEIRVTNKDNKHPVKLRITYNRKRKYYAIKGEHLTKVEFKKVFGEKSRGDFKIKRKKFEAVEDRAIDIIDNVLSDFSFDVFEKEYLTNRKHDSSIKTYFENKANELDETGKIQTATLYRATYKSLFDFDENISFSKITPKYLKKYEKWMLEQEKTHTTIGMYLRNFKHIINRAIKDNVVNVYPFGKKEDDKYAIPSGKNKKKALTIDDIGKLFNYKTDKRNVNIALNYWLFSYLSNGMNMVDIANLKYKNIVGNSLTFIRQKTKDTSIKVPIIDVLLLPQSWAIINSIGNDDKSADNYIFPIFKPNITDLQKHNILKQHIKLTNKYVRVAAKEIGINEKITTYWARHSYSTILKRSGAPTEFISEQLGHQDVKVTQSYLDTFEHEQVMQYSKSLTNFKNDSDK